MRQTLRPGNSGADVQFLQERLNRILSPSPNLQPDGHFGSRTYRAVQRLQILKNLGVDGIVGPKTWQALLLNPAPAPAVPNSVPTGGPKVAWMDVAEKEKGQSEIPGGQHNSRIVEYHSATSLKATSDETAWCSSFVNWCLKSAGVAGTNSAAAASWVNWGQPCSPQYGCIIVIYKANAANSSLTTSGNHVGFLIKDDSTHYKILGGNQSDQVKVSQFPKSSWQLKAARLPAGS